MKAQELEKRLARAAAQAAPQDLEDVLSRCGTQEGREEAVKNERTSAPRRWRALVAACLALVLLGAGGGLWYRDAHAVTSVISIDVNPSIELRVNREEKVLSCTPLNEDAHIALAEMNDGKDLEGAKLTVAVNAVVGALVRHGYLDGLSSAILVSVEDKDQARATRMEEELRASISGLLAAEAPNATILSQTLPQGAGYDTYNSYHHEDDHHSEPQISSGKAALVHKVMEMNGTLALNSTTAYDALCALTVEELNDLLETGEKRIPIGCSAASLAANVYAGTAVLSSVYTEVDPELDEVPAHYEVELHTAWGEFEYKVDAFTGEILSGPANLLALMTPRPDDLPAAPSEELALLGQEDAWAAVCKDLGISWDNLEYPECELAVWANEPYCYELEFCWKGNQYEYEIDCYTGAVLKHEWEVCDESHHSHGAQNGNHSGWSWSSVSTPAPAATPAPTVTPVPTAAPTPSGMALIGESAAWAAAYAHAGCAAGDVSYTQCELDLDPDDHCYELEFCWNGNQYEYEIDCYSGTVLKHEWETCDEEHHSHSSDSHRDDHRGDHH